MISRNKCHLLKLAAWSSVVMCFLAGSTHAWASKNVAVVTQNISTKAQAVVELAAVQLATHDHVSVVERQAIQQVLDEQQLALEGTAGGEEAITLGRLLKVDLFVVYLPSRDMARVVAFDTKLGIRLLDNDFKAGNAEADAEHIVEGVKRGLTKQDLLEVNGLAFISFHGFRNVDLASSWLPWMEQTRRQLEQCFVNTECMGVLERAQLRYVNQERMLPLAQVQARLMASSTNLMVQFSRGKQTDEVIITLIDSSPSQSEPRTFSAQLPRAGGMGEIDELVRKVQEHVTTSSALQRKSDLQSLGISVRQREAEKLRAEARRLSARKERLDAAVFSEAAYALNPEDQRHLPYLILTLDYYAEELLKPLHDDKPSSDAEHSARESKIKQAIAILDYRLDLIVTLHERCKHEEVWHLQMIANDGSFVPWHRSVSSLGKLLKQSQEANTDDIREHLSRFYEVWFGKLLAYQEQRLRSAEEVRQVIAHVYHQGRGYLRHISSARDLKPELFVEQYDQWAKTLNNRGWNQDKKQHVAAWKALLKLLDFHKYQRYEMSEAQLGLIIDRLQQAGKHPAKEIGERCRYLAASIHVERLAKKTPSRQELNGKVEQYVEELTKPILAKLSEPLPPPNQGDISQLGVLSLRMMPVRFDKRITTLAAELGGIASLHPDFDRKRQLCRKQFHFCLERDIFSPALFYGSIPSTISAADARQIPSEDFLQRVEFYREILPLLRMGQGKRSTPELEKVVKVLEDELRHDLKILKSRGADPPPDLAPHLANGKSVTPWTKLTRLEGKQGLPQQWNDPEWPRILGFGHDEKWVYYLLQHPRADQAAKVAVSLYRVRLDNPKEVRRVAQHANVGRYADLTSRQREYYGTIQSELSDGTINRVSVDKKHLYWNRIAQGIWVFPLDGSECFTLDEQAGLPSNYIHAITPANGKLYAWLGRPRKESLLVEVTPATREVSVLASSERVEAQHALDNRKPTVTKLMFFDPPKNRLVFWFRKQIWAWDLSTDTPRKLLEIKWKHEHWLRNVIPMPHRRTVLINRSKDYLLLDLNDDSVQEIPLPGTSPYGLGSPALLLEDEVWLRSPWAIYDLNSHTQHELQSPLRGQILAAYPWAQWCELAGDGSQCLIWDHFHLWLAQLDVGREE